MKLESLHVSNINSPIELREREKENGKLEIPDQTRFTLLHVRKQIAIRQSVKWTAMQ